MIRKLLATTAVAALMATGAYAQDTTTQPAQPSASPSTQSPATTQPETPMVIKAEGNLASNIIGKDVYNGTGDDAKKIGSVNDLVVNPDGQVQALVIGVGGFLGIGQKDVAIEYNLAKWEEKDNDRWLVVETTADALKAQPEFDKQAYQPMPADADVAETKPATAEDLAKAPAPEQNTASTEQQPAADQTASTEQKPADQSASTSSDQSASASTEQKPADQSASASTDQQQTASSQTQTNGAASTDQSASTDNQTAASSSDQNQNMAANQAPANDQNANATDQTKTAAIDRSSLQEKATDQIRAEEFVGTTVYGANDEKVGEIGDVVLSKEGKVDAVLIDVGGFLGMGEKEVALGMDNLRFMTDKDGKLYLYTSLSKDELEAQQAYDESTYAQNRDQMRMNVPKTE